MKNLSLLTALFAALFSTAFAIDVCKIWYAVDQDESCESIAHTVNLTVDDIVRYNRPHLNCADINIKIICLDCYYKTENCWGPEPPTPGQCNQWYVVKSGDSCYSIATANGMNVPQLETLNPGLRCNAGYIYPGQKMCIA